MDVSSWSSHVEWVILMGTILGGLYFFESKFENQMQAQGQRIDRLYEMFIELVKERK